MYPVRTPVPTSRKANSGYPPRDRLSRFHFYLFIWQIPVGQNFIRFAAVRARQGRDFYSLNF